MIENLGMSYSEIMNTEYSLLLMMQHDKPRVDYDSEKGKKIERISGAELLRRNKKRGL